MAQFMSLMLLVFTKMMKDERFIDKYKSRSILSEKAHAELISFAKEIQNHFTLLFVKGKKSLLVDSMLHGHHLKEL